MIIHPAFFIIRFPAEPKKEPAFLLTAECCLLTSE